MTNTKKEGNINHEPTHKVEATTNSQDRKSPIVASGDKDKRKKLWMGLSILAILVFAGVGTALLAQTFAAPRTTAPGKTKKTPLPLPGTAPAATNLTFNLFATHPYASKAGFDMNSVDYYENNRHLCLPRGSTNPAPGFVFVDDNGDGFCPVGQTLTDMEITNDGQLVAGYGDSTANVDSFGVAAGQVGVAPLDLATGTWGPLTKIGSESIATIRKINGNVYALTQDPSDKAATGQTSAGQSGLVTNDGGTWHFVNDHLTYEHLYDIAGTASGKLYEFGGSYWAADGTPYIANVYSSADKGATWKWEAADNSTPSSTGDNEHYGWGATLGSKVYTQAFDILPSPVPGKVIDTITGVWSTYGTAGQPVCQAWNPKNVVVFDNRIVCINNGAVTSFDGSKTQTVSGAPSAANELYVSSDGYLYVLGGSQIYRTNSLTGTWQNLGSVSSAGSSVTTMAVYNGYIYLGGPNGKIFKSNSVIQ